VYTNPQIVAARSNDLEDKLPYGTVIAIEPATSTPDCGYDVVADHVGLRVIADSMNARMHNKVDILFSSHDSVTVGGRERNAANAFGFCKDVTIYVVGKIDTTHMPETQEELVQMLQGGEGNLAINK
jgi:3D (Asp-Asp-Asp) domain-containing protein